jgi:hypothetical protein
MLVFGVGSGVCELNEHTRQNWFFIFDMGKYLPAGFKGRPGIKAYTNERKFEQFAVRQLLGKNAEEKSGDKADKQHHKTAYHTAKFECGLSTADSVKAVFKPEHNTSAPGKWRKWIKLYQHSWPHHQHMQKQTKHSNEQAVMQGKEGV